jgi:hypothetical protein
MPTRLCRLAICCCLLAATTARAQQPVAVLGEPGRPPQQIEITDPNAPKESFGTMIGAALLIGLNGPPGYGATWFPSQQVKGQPTNLGMIRQGAAIYTPIIPDGDDRAIAMFGLSNVYSYTDAILPDTGRPFPTSLWDIEAGFGYSHVYDNDWTVGAMFSVGSASDKPFDRNNTLNISTGLYGTAPAMNQDVWIFGILYSRTLDIPYPIPAISYYWRSQEDIEMNIGVPFLMKWKPWKGFQIDAYYMPIRIASVKASWDLGEGWHAYTAFNWFYDAFFLYDRPNNSDRFFGYEKRLTAGLQFDLPLSLQLDVSAGWAFDRFFFQGRYYSDRNFDRVSVESGPFAALSLGIRF